jgi:alkylated DNA repair protein (DNA oxidative demethylase)
MTPDLFADQPVEITTETLSEGALVLRHFASAVGEVWREILLGK